MVEVRYKPHHSGNTPEARVASRLRNSGVGPDHQPDHVVQKGDSPLRTFTNIHSAGHVYDRKTEIAPNDGVTQRGHDSATTQKGGGNG
jgi:hypothetical protein